LATTLSDRLRDHHVTLAAAGVAFFGFLALVPAIAATLSIYGLVADPDTAADQIADLSAGLPGSAQALLEEQVRSITTSSTGSLSITALVSLVIALWSASAGMAHLVEAVKIAFEADDPEGFVKRRGQALWLTLVAAVGAVVTLVAITVVPRVLADAVPGGLRWLFTALTWLVIAAAFVLALSVLYRIGDSSTGHSSADGAPVVSAGSLVALAVWLAASVAFSFYATNVGSYNETYGSLAAIVVLLLWLFLSAFAVLVGAEFEAERRQAG
jgi:membrane protein